jgi:predicted dehydrogenase
MERRKFIQMTSAGTAALASGLYIRPLADDKKLKVGLVGSGWYGMVITKAALKVGGVEIIGVCDVDSDHLNNSAAEIEKLQGQRPKTFKNYHELLDMNGLEAVFIGTPPHWHALQFIAACEKKLDIYCEKPLSYDIKEGIAMVNAAARAGNIVQIGFQRRQSEAFGKARELIADGRIGKVHQIVAQINYNPEMKDNTIQPPPASLDWEEWCGPAPKLDYRPNIGHLAWRLEKEYGNGHLVDWGIHHIDIIRHIMGEGMPDKIYSSGGLFQLQGKITTPDTLTSQMSFKTAPLLWQHRLWGIGDADREFNNGIFFHGDKGTLFAQDSSIVIFDGGKENKRDEQTFNGDDLPEKHMKNFLDAVKARNGKSLACLPTDAFQSTATVQLAMISYYTGSMVRWDAQNKTIIGNDDAAKLLRREYRGKYQHP